MSYKSLLFCPDEKSARLVTQVLSELDFTIEIAGETYATVKKLNDQHFDALVVDCQNEQDATVLFKAAKNSSENHTSLTVAVVEGQAGVAKAFRMGANLVLTKPINVEQSKGTLRVARGLLKKNQPKPAGEVTSAPSAAFVVSNAAAPAPAPAISFSATAASSFSAAAAAPALEKPAHVEVPYAGLEVEKETLPGAEAADAAVLDSLPQLSKTPIGQPAGSSLLSHAASAPDFAGLSGASAAAAAPALEKKTIELHAAASAPQFTNDPIVKDVDAPQAFAADVATPTFSSLESHSTSQGGTKTFFKIAAVLLVIVMGGLLGWRKLQSMHNGSRDTSESTTVESSTTQTQPQAPASAPAHALARTVALSPTAGERTAVTSNTEEEISANASATKNQHSADADNIEIQEMPFSRDTKVTVTPKPQALIVKAGSAKPAAPASAPLTAPSLDLAANNSATTIANLMPAEATLPKPAPGTIRISQGVSQGLLLKKISPSYPAMALQLHKEGIVQLLATVSREGRISNLKVLSGDAMLVKSATDAVRQWQYRPYLLDGQPFEVETQISVSFKLPR